MRASSLPITQFKGIPFVFENFLATWGWLEKFKQKYVSANYFLNGKSEAAPDPNINKCIAELPYVTQNIDVKYNLNCDKTVSNYCLLQTKTHNFKGETCHDGKKSKV